MACQEDCDSHPPAAILRAPGVLSWAQLSGDINLLRGEPREADVACVRASSSGREFLKGRNHTH